MINLALKYPFRNIARILAPCILFFAAPSCKNDPNEIRALTGKSHQTEDHAQDVTVVYSKEGKPNMRVFAHDFVRNEGIRRPYIDMNTRLKVEFFNDSTGVIDDILTADSSRYYEAQGDMIIWDSVQIITKKGEKLQPALQKKPTIAHITTT